MRLACARREEKTDEQHSWKVELQGDLPVHVIEGVNSSRISSGTGAEIVNRSPLRGWTKHSVSPCSAWRSF
jgi:hypothetical protein